MFYIVNGILALTLICAQLFLVIHETEEIIHGHAHQGCEICLVAHSLGNAVTTNSFDSTIKSEPIQQERTLISSITVPYSSFYSPRAPPVSAENIV